MGWRVDILPQSFWKNNKSAFFPHIFVPTQLQSKQPFSSHNRHRNSRTQCCGKVPNTFLYAKHSLRTEQVQHRGNWESLLRDTLSSLFEWCHSSAWPDTVSKDDFQVVDSQKNKERVPHCCIYILISRAVPLLSWCGKFTPKPCWLQCVLKHRWYGIGWTWQEQRKWKQGNTGQQKNSPLWLKDCGCTLWAKERGEIKLNISTAFHILRSVFLSWEQWQKWNFSVRIRTNCKTWYFCRFPHQAWAAAWFYPEFTFFLSSS